jgi:hypothetical protein
MPSIADRDPRRKRHLHSSHSPPGRRPRRLTTEGFVGHALVIGTRRTPHHVICKLASTWAAVRADTLRDLLRLEGRLQTLLLHEFLGEMPGVRRAAGPARPPLR